MNQLIELKGNFEQKSSGTKPGFPKLPAGKSISSDHLRGLVSQIKIVSNFWSTNTLVTGSLVCIHYNSVIAKSNRIAQMFVEKNSKPNDTIVGAKFARDENKHIITHYLKRETLQNTIVELNEAIVILDTYFGGTATADLFTDKNVSKIDFSNYRLSKSNFSRIVVDAFYVEFINVEETDYQSDGNSIVSLFKTENDVRDVLQKIGINIMPGNILDETMVYLSQSDLAILKSKANYLIAMSVSDLNELNLDEFTETNQEGMINIPEPQNEPVVGVIDTLFDTNVYFNKWVEYENCLDKSIPIDQRDFIHGTGVTSIIVDGPRLNPELNDGIGRLRVRHFGVAVASGFNSFNIIKKIEEIIIKNKDIKVWNLSLGSAQEINPFFISAEAAILDRIQFENDVIFIISGTNKNKIDPDKKIGAPADSLNSIVVNSVGFNNEIPNYVRSGPVLKYFAKPDVSYYGGNSSSGYVNVVEPLGIGKVAGTSYAAPWITRKVAYLIYFLNMSREEAKAIIIDSAIDQNNSSYSLQVGHGIVPIKIEDIVNSKNDEIKFFVSGVSEKFDTYNYKFPVPLVNDKYPFAAKATMVYFPKTSRNQGVDYTNTELDVYFGRIKNDGSIKSINDNVQSVDDGVIYYTTEEKAREIYDKWNNVKVISQSYNERTKPKKSYNNKLWGLSVKTKERLQKREGEGIRFCVVVTLKEIKGVNRIEDFIQNALLNGWIINRINLEQRIDLFQKASQVIEFDE